MHGLDPSPEHSSGAEGWQYTDSHIAIKWRNVEECTKLGTHLVSPIEQCSAMQQPGIWNLGMAPEGCPWPIFMLNFCTDEFSK
jgi:hypothetical protein